MVEKFVSALVDRSLVLQRMVEYLLNILVVGVDEEIFEESLIVALVHAFAD